MKHVPSDCATVTLVAENVPRLTIKPSAVRIDRINMGKTQQISLHIHNAGGGALHGKVRATVPWLKPSPIEFANDTDISVTVESSYLKSGIAYRGIIEVNTEEGQMQQVPIHVARVIPTSRTSVAAPLTPRQSSMLKRGFALTAMGILVPLLPFPVLLVWPQSLGVFRLLLDFAIIVEGVGIVWNLTVWRLTRRHKLSSAMLAGSILFSLLLILWRSVV